MMTSSPRNQPETEIRVEASVSGAPAEPSKVLAITDLGRSTPRPHARLKATWPQASLALELLKDGQTWTTERIRLALGERLHGERGATTLVVLGLATRPAQGKYRISSLGREWEKAPTRSAKAEVLRKALLECQDFSPYWRDLTTKRKEFGNSEVSRILETNFGFKKWSARNYASTLVHYASRSGLAAPIVAARGPTGKYKAVENFEMPSDTDAIPDQAESLAGFIRQLDRAIISLGRFLADPERLTESSLRAALASQFRSLPSAAIPNGDGELVELYKKRVALTTDGTVLPEYQLLFQELEALSRRLLKKANKDRVGREPISYAGSD
jgi:hypothetical protein